MSVNINKMKKWHKWNILKSKIRQNDAFLLFFLFIRFFIISGYKLIFYQSWYK